MSPGPASSDRASTHWLPPTAWRTPMATQRSNVPMHRRDESTRARPRGPDARPIGQPVFEHGLPGWRVSIAAVRRIAHNAGQNATRRARTPASSLRYRTTHNSSGSVQRTTGAGLTHGDAPRRREHARRPSRRRPRPGLTAQDPVGARRLHRHDSD